LSCRPLRTSCWIVGMRPAISSFSGESFVGGEAVLPAVRAAVLAAVLDLYLVCTWSVLGLYLHRA